MLFCFLLLYYIQHLIPHYSCQQKNAYVKCLFLFLFSLFPGIILLLSVCYGCISLVAIFGNLLVILVVTFTRSMHSVTNFYIANLAFADVIIAVFCIPFQFYAALLQRWDLPQFMCKFCPFTQTCLLYTSPSPRD